MPEYADRIDLIPGYEYPYGPGDWTHLAYRTSSGPTPSRVLWRPVSNSTEEFWSAPIEEEPNID